MKIACVFVFLTNIINAQKIDTDSIKTPMTNQQLSLNYKKVIIPSLLIAYGIVGIESDQLKLFNTQIKEEVNENIDRKITMDDFTQYLPATSVYSLNAFGVKGKHNFKDRTDRKSVV